MNKCRALTPELFMAELALTQDAVLIDVRTPGELSEEHRLSGALHMDFLDTDFDDQILDLDPFAPCYLYCDTGKRSALACERLLERGFMVISYLRGGKIAWNEVFTGQDM